MKIYTKLLITFLLVVVCDLFPQKLSFVHLSDTHIGSPKADSLLELSIKKINSLGNVDFVVVTGDVTEKGTADEIAKAKSLLSKIKVSCYVLAGNHDARYSFDDLFVFNKNFNTRFFFNKNGIDFIGINTAIPTKSVNGFINEFEVRWLKKQLANKKGKYTVLFTHHPLDDIENIDRVFNETKLKVSVMFSGHQHKNFYLVLGGVKNIIVNANKYLKGGFNVVAIEKDSIRIKHYTHSNEVIDLYKFALIDVQFNGKSSEIFEIDKNFSVKFKEFGKKTLYNSPAVLDSLLYFGFYDGVIKCQTINGKTIWQNRVQGNIIHSPIVVDSLLVVATTQGDISTFELFTGKQIQSIGTGYSLSSPLFELDYKGNKTLFFRKYQNKVPSFGIFTADGNLLVYEVYMLQPLQQIKLAEGPIQNKPIVENNKIYFSSSDGNVYCADPFNGIVFWKYFHNDDIYNNSMHSIINLYENNLFFSSTGGSLVCINKDLGKLNWKLDLDNAGYVSKNIQDTIFVVGKQNNFYKVNLKNGKLLGKINLQFDKNYHSNSILELNNTLYFQLSNGALYSYQNGVLSDVAYTSSITPNNLQLYNNNLIITNIAGDLFVISKKK